MARPASLLLLLLLAWGADGYLLSEGLQDMNSLWFLTCSMLIFLMQMGLAFLKAGSVRSSAVLSTLSQNMGDICIAGAMWWLVGFGIAYGPGNPFAGNRETNFVFGSRTEDVNAVGFPEFLLSLTYMSVAVGISCSGMIERTRIEVYYAFIAVIAAVGFPIAAHWTWGVDGWLNPLSDDKYKTGMLDGCGAATVHVFGGTMALVAATFIGHRVLPDDTKLFSAKGKEMVPGHNKFYQATGSLLMWFGWFGFNMSGITLQRGVAIGLAANAAVNTCLSAGMSVVTAILISREFVGYYELQHAVNAALVGLVTMSGCGAYVEVAFAPLIGFIASLLYFLARYARLKLQIDDVLDAGAISFTGGVWGTIATGLFADKQLVMAATGTDSYGAFVGGGGDQLGMQLLGLVCIIAWSALCTILVLLPFHFTVGLRIKAKKELRGLDKVQHGGSYRSESWMKKVMQVQDIETSSQASSMGDDSHIMGLKGGATLPTIIRCAALAGFVAIITATGLTQTTTDSSPAAPSLEDEIGTTWVLVCAILVFSMQLGFCFLEVGGVRSVNVINIVFKNLGDAAIGSVCFWVTGFGIAYADGSAFMGCRGNLFVLSPDPTDEEFGQLATFLLAFTYMTSAVTIVSGAVAERISLEAYYTFVVVTTSFAYPVVVHWIWSEHGFLNAAYPDLPANGTLDFAGSIVIHLFGGVAALTGAAIIGPRKLPGIEDVFSAEGQDHVSPHNKFSQAVGTLLLWFGWYAFNGGSVGSLSSEGSFVASNAIVTTMVASAFSVTVCLVISKVVYGYYDMGHLCNSALTGLVSITAGCAYVSPYFAPIIGAVGTLVYFGVYKLRLKLRIDDVLDAGAVHGGGGVWGGIAVGLFADRNRILKALGTDKVADYGLFLGGGWKQLGMQLLGIVCVAAWAMAVTALVCLFCKYTFGVRVSQEAELRGLDITEHKTHSYDYIGKMEMQKMENEMHRKRVANLLNQLQMAKETIPQLKGTDRTGTEKVVAVFDAVEKMLDEQQQQLPPNPQLSSSQPDIKMEKVLASDSTDPKESAPY